MLDYSTDEWLKKKAELEEKYGIIFLSDVLYKPEEWEKFEKWYADKLQKKKELKKQRNKEAR